MMTRNISAKPCKANSEKPIGINDFTSHRMGMPPGSGDFSPIEKDCPT
jgi:hypothetical protein